MTKSATVTTFTEFHRVFEATFTYKRSRSEKLRVMMARTQGHRESVQEYVLDKVWLCHGLDLPVNDIRDEVAAGLWSRELAHYLLENDYASTDDILQDLVQVEKIPDVRRGRFSEQRDRRGDVT